MLHVNKRGLVRIAAPATEPLTLTETKLYLRVTGSAEDSLITDLITVAREYAEQFMRRSLLTQTWQLVLADYVQESFLLPMGPVQSITEIRAIAQDGTSSVVASDAYQLDMVTGMISFHTLIYAHRIEIDYVCGVATAADIAKSIRYGMLSHIAQMFDKRGEIGGELPADCRALYAPHREVLL